MAASSQSRRGRRPIDIARSISPRLADAGHRRQGRRELYDLTRPLEKDASLQISHGQGRRVAGCVPPFRSPSSGRGRGSSSFRNQAGHRAGHRQRFLLRLRTAPRRSRRKTSRRSKRKCGRSNRATSPTSASTRARTKVSKKYADAWMKCRVDRRGARAGLLRIHPGTATSSISAAGPHVPARRGSGVKLLFHSPAPIGRVTSTTSSWQRIYGTAFFTQKELDAYLKQVEEAKKRDHRKLGKELTFQHPGAGRPGTHLFHPKGGIIRKQLEDWMRDRPEARLLRWSIPLHVARFDLWEDFGPPPASTRRTCSRRWNWTMPSTSSSP